MNGVRLLQQVDLAGAHDDRNAVGLARRAPNFVAGLSVRLLGTRVGDGSMCGLLETT
jgi:hypothetical protein